MRTWMISLVAAAAGGPLYYPQAAPRGSEGGPRLYYFFSPRTASSVDGAVRAVRFIREHKGEIRFRPVMLLEEFSVIRKLEESSPLARTIKELQKLGPLDLPLYDEQGLGLAESWEVRSVPSFVLVAGGRAHRALGPTANLEELLQCRP